MQNYWCKHNKAGLTTLLDLLVLVAGPGPGAMRGQPVRKNSPGPSQSHENLQQMKKLMEQELKNDKYKANSNKGYVFTLMPLYAIGVGVFAAYKFLKVKQVIYDNEENFWQGIDLRNDFVLLYLQIKSADDQAQKESFVKGAKKSVEAGVCVCVFLLFAYQCFL